MRNPNNSKHGVPCSFPRVRRTYVRSVGSSCTLVGISDLSGVGEMRGMGGDERDERDRRDERDEWWWLVMMADGCGYRYGQPVPINSSERKYSLSASRTS